MARLEPLKTVHQARTEQDFEEAWIAEIPTKLANVSWTLLKPLVSTDAGVPALHHLRRLVNQSNLPPRFRENLGIPEEKNSTLFLLVGPHHLISSDEIREVLKTKIQDETDLPKLFSTTVPIFPPTSIEQAGELSTQYWPCVFNPASQTLQQAPPLHLLRTTQAELDTEHLDTYIRLARLVGNDAAVSRVGRGIGAVIVNPVSKEVVATACDARWWTPRTPGHENSVSRDSEGRPEHHALMRAVAMVAQKEIRRRSNKSQPDTLESLNMHSHDLEGRPLTSIEHAYFSAPQQTESTAIQHLDFPAAESSIRSDGYLCNGLDVYLTHEPCACCTMAMIHSRFRVCIFNKRMPGTGALSADFPGLGYGLFWRKELNWRVIAFQYRQIDTESGDVDDGVATFHA